MILLWAISRPPPWKGIPRTAYIDLLIQNANNDAGVANSIKNTSGADHALSDGGPYQTCGAWADGQVYMPASSWQLINYMIPGTTDLSSYLEPETVYYFDARNILSIADHLYLSNMYARLRLTFMSR